MNKLVCGVGIYEKGKYLGNVQGMPTKEYKLWTSMLRRCYSKSYQNGRPTYRGCSVSDSFKNFQLFGDWCQSQIGFKVDNYQLDKDILVPDNKEYSPEVCVFVPHAINSLFTSSKVTRGDLPVGVYLHKGINKYVAMLSEGNGKSKYLGCFDRVEDASEVYKRAKELFVKEQAFRYRDSIDPRVYTALMLWQV